MNLCLENNLLSIPHKDYYNVTKIYCAKIQDVPLKEIMRKPKYLGCYSTTKQTLLPGEIKYIETKIQSKMPQTYILGSIFITESHKEKIEIIRGVFDTLNTPKRILIQNATHMRQTIEKDEKIGIAMIHDDLTITECDEMKETFDQTKFLLCFKGEIMHKKI